MKNYQSSPTNSPNKCKIDLKNYQINEEIKKNQFSSIYSIQRKNTQNFYAAKVIYTEEDKTQSQSKIERQVIPLIRLQHPAIIKYYGYSLQDFERKNNITLIMDLAKNGSLTNYIKDIQKSSFELFYSNTVRQKILIGIVRGMMYLNSHNVAPSILTPNKILLDECYNPLITDYGLSKLKQESTEGESNLIYMAPETISDGKYNIKSGIYSFGIIMYEIITGSIPYPKFQNGNITESQFKNEVTSENYRPEFKVTVKPALKGLIEKCWSSDPNERPTFENIFKKLAFNADESNDELNSDESNDKYYLADIDVGDLHSYIRIVTKNDSIKYDQYMKKRTESKNSFTISTFNSAPLKSQHFIISKAINNDSEDDQFLIKISNLLFFILKFNISGKVNYIEIHTSDDEDTFEILKESDDAQIFIHFCTIEMLCRNRQFNPVELINILKQFSNFSIELNYPSDSFKEAYNIISKIKKEHVEQMKINVSISGLRKTDEMFTYKADINSIKIDSSLNTIGSNAFSGCSSLTEITIPSSLTTIEKSAFLSCSSLNKIVIPESVTSIGDRAFYECLSLKEINIPSSVKSIGKAAFYLCSSLTKIAIPSSITSIADGTFVDCKSLVQVSIPQSIKSIGECAFSKCISLSQIDIPKSVTSIAKGAFFQCSSITDITIPSLNEILEHQYQECQSLTKIVIPPSVKIIKDCAFCKCSSLIEITIPSTVKSIGKGAFYGCSSLEKITIPTSLKLIDLGVFQECTSLHEIEIPSSVTEIGNSSFRDCSKLQNILIPSSVIKINIGAFYNCESLTEIQIPSSVKSIGLSAFKGCTSLSKITIPSSVTEIGKAAFEDCSSLKKVILPSSLSSIGERAFPETAEIVRE